MSNKKEKEHNDILQALDIINKNINSLYIMQVKLWKMQTHYCPFCKTKTTTRVGPITDDEGKTVQTDLLFCEKCDRYLYV